LSNLDADDDSGLGIENGSFKWNEVEQTDQTKPNTNYTNAMSNDITTAADDLGPEETDTRFKLGSIDIRFPEKQLSLITGPTASGKTALLVCTNRFCLL
jgi:ABC-type transport system involved in cytochrome bd biosynthesis fused ATPase/permease subunit